MGSETAVDGMFDWDPIAEEELRSIERAYDNAKRKASPCHLDPHLHHDDFSDQPRFKGRRLPNWANSSAENSSRSWAFSPRPCQVNFKVKHPQMSFGGRIVYCRTTAEVEQAAAELLEKIKARRQNEGQISLGFDIEWKPTFRSGEAPRKAALMQICMDTSQCYVLHIFHSGIPPILESLLGDSSSVKVGVCIGNDAMKISRDYNVSVEPLEDLSEYANQKRVGTLKRWSLSSLTEMLTCKELPKPTKIRMGNWEVAPLSREQLQYAATDAYVSWYLYEVMKTFPDPEPESDAKEKDPNVEPESDGPEKGSNAKPERDGSENVDDVNTLMP